MKNKYTTFRLIALLSILSIGATACKSAAPKDASVSDYSIAEEGNIPTTEASLDENNNSDPEDFTKSDISKAIPTASLEESGIHPECIELIEDIILKKFT